MALKPRNFHPKKLKTKCQILIQREHNDANQLKSIRYEKKVKIYNVTSPSLFTTLYQHLVSKDTNLCSFKEIFSYSCFIYDFICSPSWGLLCSYFCTKCFGMQKGQLSTHLILIFCSNSLALFSKYSQRVTGTVLSVQCFL